MDALEQADAAASSKAAAAAATVRPVPYACYFLFRFLFVNIVISSTTASTIIHVTIKITAYIAWLSISRLFSIMWGRIHRCQSHSGGHVSGPHVKRFDQRYYNKNVKCVQLLLPIASTYTAPAAAILNSSLSQVQGIIK